MIVSGVFIAGGYRNILKGTTRSVCLRMTHSLVGWFGL